jgi:hypothetical protein
VYLIHYHPAAALRSPEIKATMQRDFQRIKLALKPSS